MQGDGIKTIYCLKILCLLLLSRYIQFFNFTH